MCTRHLTHPPPPYPLGLAGDPAALLVTAAREAVFACCNSPYGDWDVTATSDIPTLSLLPDLTQPDCSAGQPGPQQAVAALRY